MAGSLDEIYFAEERDKWRGFVRKINFRLHNIRKIYCQPEEEDRTLLYEVKSGGYRLKMAAV